MPTELIYFATTYANGKPQPMKYMNKILSSWHTKNITSIEDAKKCGDIQETSKPTPKQTQKDYKERAYTKEEISSLFTSLEEIDI